MVLRGGAKAEGAAVQLTEAAAAAPGGDQGHDSRVLWYGGDEGGSLQGKYGVEEVLWG